MVVQRWGTYRYTQHKGVTFAGGEGGKVMKVDLSALAKGAKVHRARLVFTAGKGYEVAVGGKDLKLVEPYCLWFDATEAVRAWVANGKAAAPAASSRRTPTWRSPTRVSRAPQRTRRSR
ncbi:hypothetical protein LCGC14_2933930 [marine sediment metagenome]|uniref:Uncharacterized protein n=1 Tax=marine sediment metagenome TaxID=412755 RepID=A0A0F8XJZ5_9ZZZZ